MAKKLAYNYDFIPGAAGAGVLKVPGNHPQRVFLLATNVTRSTIIYNFAGAGFGGSTSYDPSKDETTLTLESDTSTHNTNDEIQIFLDIREDRIDFSETFVDPVSKLRVSNPQNLIDTDFEYGLQSTKWETIEIVDNIPSTYTRASSVSIGEIQQVNTIANDNVVTVITGVPHDLKTGDPIEVQGTSSRTANGKYIVLGVSSETQFSYRSSDVQSSTANIREAYTTIIPGSFFASADINYNPNEGISTDAASPSTLEFTTDYKHGLSQNTSVYITNTVGKKVFDIANTSTNAADGSPFVNTTDNNIFLQRHNLVNDQKIYIYPEAGGTVPSTVTGAPEPSGADTCDIVFTSVETACDSIRTTCGNALNDIYTRYNNPSSAYYVSGNWNVSPPSGTTGTHYQSLIYGDYANNAYAYYDLKTSSNVYRGNYSWAPFGWGTDRLYIGEPVNIGANMFANSTALSNGFPTTLDGRAYCQFTRNEFNTYKPHLVSVWQFTPSFEDVDPTYNRGTFYDNSYRTKTPQESFWSTRTERNFYSFPNTSLGNGWRYTYAYVYYYPFNNYYAGFMKLDITLVNDSWTRYSGASSSWNQSTWNYSTYSLDSRDFSNQGDKFQIEALFLVDDDVFSSSFGASGSVMNTATMANTICTEVANNLSYGSFTNPSGESAVRATIVNGDRVSFRSDNATRNLIKFSNTGTGPIAARTDQVAGVADDFYKLSSVANTTASISASSQIAPRVLEFSDTDVIDDNGLYYINIPTGHGIKSGSKVIFTIVSGSTIAGITSGTTYYAITPDDKHLQLAASVLDWNVGSNSISGLPASTGSYTITINSIDGRVTAGGTVTITEGSSSVTGTNTKFLSNYKVGDNFVFTPTGGTINNYLTYRIGSVISDTSLTLTSSAATTETNVNHFVDTKINVRADGQFLHRPFDGGVEITAGKSPDSQIVRQTRKYFRYQSGKGIQCSVAINFNPARPVKTISGSGSSITVTTEYPHGLNAGNYVLIQGVEEKTYYTPSTASYVPTTGKLTLTVNSHGFNVGEEISLAENSLTFTCAKDGNATNHSYPRTSDPAGNNTRLKITYVDTNTFTVNVGTSSDTSTHYFVSASTNAITHYDTSNAYNGTYEVDSVTDFTFSYTSSGTVVVASPTGFGEYAIARYTNAGVRCGLFDFQNGFFYEYDGKQLYAVRRSSVQQLSGTVSVSTGSNIINGSGTSFTKNLVNKDMIVLRGQSYKITSVESDTVLHVQPAYRGVSTTGAVVTKTVDVKVPQSEWSIDKADGSGPSAFNLDIHKIQMVYMDYSWYGAGKIRFGFKDTYGHVKYMHEFIHNNRLNEAYMRSGNIPGRYEVYNSGDPTFVPSIFHWGTSVIMDGRFDNDDSYLFSAAGKTLTFTNGDVTTATTTGASFLTSTRVAGRLYDYYVRIPFAVADASKFSVGTPLYVPTGQGTLNGETVAYTQYSGSTFYVYIFVQRSYTIPASYPDAGNGATVSIGGPSGGGVSVDLNSRIPLISIRLAPSVDNNIIGNLGERDIINRMQLKLKELGVSVTHDATISVVLNGNISNLNYENVGTPSLSQYIAHESGDTINEGILVYQFRASGGSESTTGKRLSISSAFDLSQLSDLGNSILGGDDVFPNGPDIMTICATVIDTSEVDSGSSFRVSSRLSWSESQA